ncbi:hypothetical protein BSK59_19975 [Paenibacillus odorifer]|uniref:hypothetical protein n=1 Tax=Paenibacillus odorifer TaxID=189426 RepID=UPI00096FEDFA|nr:hypothetical protein [Paenibacillus odorifer]OME51801.1 hypothetical protein BSK59_19975 [Paenibacillus odorifer]
MPYQTDERLKSYLDTNQLHREQLCRSILAIDKRFSEVHPRHPRGGPDGGRDIEAIYRDGDLAFGAIGFLNQANDSEEQKKTIKAKFEFDLRNALSADVTPKVFIFFTNINFTIGEKNTLIEKAKEAGILFCELLDRERLRISLDSPDGFSIRFQYLNIPLSEEEQASFFARWGDDIQSVISTGFQRIESTLQRVLFLQECNDVLSHFTLSFELDRAYQAEEIGHFRLFCLVQLKEPKQKILSFLFGSSDKPKRMSPDSKLDIDNQMRGIKNGISGGQWVEYFNTEVSESDDTERYESRGYFSSIGQDLIDFLPISFRDSSFVRVGPAVTLKDLDEAIFIAILNRSLAEKVKTIHLYSNGYKIQEFTNDEFHISDSNFNPEIPVMFTEDELNDSWVSIRPIGSSFFSIDFFEKTPKRMFTPKQM